MGRRLLFALVAACAMFAASLTVLLAIMLLPRVANSDLFGDNIPSLVDNIPFVSTIDKQEQARLAQRLLDGYAYQRDGDYDQAVAAFGEVAAADPKLADTREALFHLGQTHLLNRDYGPASVSLQQFYDRYTEDQRRHDVAFMLGMSYRGLSQWDKAIGFLTGYAERDTVIEPYTRYQLGLALRDSGDLPKAIEEFGKAVTGSGLRLFEIEAMEQIAAAYIKLKDYDSAVAWYEKLKARAATDGYKSELNYLTALAYKAEGKVAEAKGLFLYDIVNYPASSSALLSLDELNTMDPKAVGYYQEGLVYYLNGKLDKAVASLGQALASPNEKNASDALYFLGMSYQKQGNQSQAIAKFDQLMRGYASSGRVGDAWFQKAESQSLAKSYADAIVTYRQFATSLPQHELAQQARWEAAQLLEGLRRFDEARKEYATLQLSYPGSKLAEDAMFRQGLSYFREKQYDRAVQAWDDYLKAYPAGAQKARGAFWAGKSAQLAGKTAEANIYLQQAVQASPDEYYGFRAKAISLPVTVSLSLDRVKQSLMTPDSDKEREDAVTWLGKWVSPPPTISVLSTITFTIQEDLGFKKGQELLKVGLKQEAANEFREVIGRFRTDGVAQLELALFFRDNELYDLSIGSAARVAALSGEKSYLNLPRFLLKLLYPPYYGNLVLIEADKAGFDPLLMMSLIRQESNFNKAALSSANARGLTQVIPSTGEWLAQKLGIQSFSHSDLDKPYLSIRFGATYLGGVLKQFDGNAFFALAGYNGGPGNVSRWSNNDPKYDTDLFTEDIDYSETKLYVKLVSENYEMYRFIYAATTD